MASVEPVLSSRAGGRIGATLVALLASAFAVTSVSAIQSARAHSETAEAIGAVAALLAFSAVALSQGWYAWRGWKRPNESRLSRTIRWATTGFVVWGLLGTLITVVGMAIATSRDAGMLPVFAWLSAPLGAIIGAVRALRHN